MKKQYSDEEIFDRKTRRYIKGSTKGDLIKLCCHFKKDIFILIFTFIFSLINYPSESIFSTWIILAIEIIAYALYIGLSILNSRNERKNNRLKNKKSAPRFCEELIDRHLQDNTVFFIRILLSMTYIVVITIFAVFTNNTTLALSVLDALVFMITIAYYDIFGGLFNGIQTIIRLPKESLIKEILFWLLFSICAMYKYFDTIRSINTFIEWIS